MTDGHKKELKSIFTTQKYSRTLNLLVVILIVENCKLFAYLQKVDVCCKLQLKESQTYEEGRGLITLESK